VKSQRELDTMKHIKVDRKFFDLVESREAEGFKRLEDLGSKTEGGILIAVTTRVQPGKEAELNKWYREEHLELMSKVPGWLRTRRFITSSVEPKDEVEYLNLYDFTSENGLGGEELRNATNTPWTKYVEANVVQEKVRRLYSQYYIFGPAPRDLSVLSNADLPAFVYTNGKTRTFPASSNGGGSIESYVTTADGVELAYRLEGSPEPNAPLIVFSNCILVDWGIWEGIIAAFPKYRILRYRTRGRTSDYGDKAITVDLLASDIIALLDALRVPKAAALIGVSLGGATVLNTALKYPERVGAFIACDTNANSPAGNSKAWGERAAVAEEEGAKGQNGERIVGEKLAELTIRRWAVKESYDGGAVEARVRAVKEMIANNSLEGFKKSVQALFDYNLRCDMKQSSVPGAFFVGGGDGILPGVMKEMAGAFGTGAEYVVIEGVGHLPMVEKPQEFAAAATRFLEGK